MIATHVSRPMRSASASGPIGCAKPSFATVSIACGFGHALEERIGRLVDERHEDPVRDEAGQVAGLGRRLPKVERELRVIAAAASSEVSRPRITSTSFQHGHRVEEVHADLRAPAAT